MPDAEGGDGGEPSSRRAAGGGACSPPAECRRGSGLRSSSSRRAEAVSSRRAAERFLNRSTTFSTRETNHSSSSPSPSDAQTRGRADDAYPHPGPERGGPAVPRANGTSVAALRTADGPGGKDGAKGGLHRWLRDALPLGVGGKAADGLGPVSFRTRSICPVRL